MKKLFKLFLISIMVFGCETQDKCDDTAVCLPKAESTWKLVEVLADPGNGMGTFSPVDSNRRLIFYQDGSFLSNGSLCEFSVNNDKVMEGFVNEINGQLEFTGCNVNAPDDVSTLSYEINDDELIIAFLCVEPCQWKFRRVIIN